MGLALGPHVGKACLSHLLPSQWLSRHSRPCLASYLQDQHRLRRTVPISVSLASFDSQPHFLS